MYRGYNRRPANRLPIVRGVLELSRMSAALAGALPQVPQAAAEPFIGITTNGIVVPELFDLRDSGTDFAAAAAAAHAFLSSLDSAQIKQAQYPIDGIEWRMWTNSFPSWEPHGVRLDECDADLAYTVIEASLSAAGYTEVRTALRLNGALGHLIGQYADTLTETCYFFAIFGSPSANRPWGWQLWGHHVDVSCFVIGGQMVMTPAFIGAEPTEIDEGPHAGTRMLQGQRAAGLELRRSLTGTQLADAVLHRSMRNLPAELDQPADGRHKAGAGQDNRVIPYEGARASELSARQIDLLEQLISTYAERMRENPAAEMLTSARRHFDETYIAWIGGCGDDEPFYYKIHSPVVLIEYDCQRGAFLDNDEPEPFHVHTIVRTPNGGDYGRDLLRQHLARHHAK